MIALHARLSDRDGRGSSCREEMRLGCSRPGDFLVGNPWVAGDWIGHRRKGPLVMVMEADVGGEGCWVRES